MYIYTYTYTYTYISLIVYYMLILKGPKICGCQGFQFRPISIWSWSKKNMTQTCVHCSFPRFEDETPNISQLWLEVVLLSIYEPLVLKWTSTHRLQQTIVMLPTDRKNSINSRSSHRAAWSLGRADRFEKFLESSCALAPRNKPGTSLSDPDQELRGMRVQGQANNWGWV